MKISLEVPRGFLGIGITMVFKDETGLNMYSATVTPDEIVNDKVVQIPRGQNNDDK